MRVTLGGGFWLILSSCIFCYLLRVFGGYTGTVCIHRYTGTQVHRYTGTQVHRYTGTQVHRYTGTQVHRYTGTQVHRYTGTQVHRYTGTQVHRYTGTCAQDAFILALLRFGINGNYFGKFALFERGLPLLDKL